MQDFMIGEHFIYLNKTEIDKRQTEASTFPQQCTAANKIQKSS